MFVNPSKVKTIYTFFTYFFNVDQTLKGHKFQFTCGNQTEILVNPAVK